MPIDSARAFFEAVAARGHEPRLTDAVGTWEFDVDGAGTWTVTVDHGALAVASAAGAKPTTTLRLDEVELLRLVSGDGHENLFMAMIRGAVGIEGQLAFAARLQAILPIPEEWRTGT